MSQLTKIAGYFARKRHSALDKIIRVNHSGDLGADRIYHGQNFVLHKDKTCGPMIQEMWNQEKEHLEEMEYMSLKYRTRKSLLEPLWSVGGFILGAGSALLGPKSAMACTMAVENVITQHYNDQIREIIAENGIKDSAYILDKLSKFRDDEQHHHDTAEKLEGSADQKDLIKLVDLICKASIKIAGKI